MRERIIVVARAFPAGWAALLLAVFVIERPLLSVTARFLDDSWFPTVRLGLECTALAGTGWVIGRLSRSVPVLPVLIFAATLAPWDSGDLSVRWLFRLAADTFHDLRYFESFLNTALLQVFLFGSLIAGAMLSRSRTTPLSIR